MKGNRNKDKLTKKKEKSIRNVGSEENHNCKIYILVQSHLFAGKVNWASRLIVNSIRFNEVDDAIDEILNNNSTACDPNKDLSLCYHVIGYFSLYWSDFPGQTSAIYKENPYTD